MPQPSYSAVKVEVEVSGVKGQIYDNILSMLTIYLQKDNERLQSNGVRRLHMKAKEDIRKALAPFGYYNPQVRPRLERQGDGWRAEYIVDKGAPIRIENVDITIVGDGSGKSVLVKAINSFALKKGDILDQQLYEKEKKRLANLAYAEGFLDVTFSKRMLRVDPASNSATIEMVLDTGTLYVFGTTTSAQDVLTQEVLQRYLPYEEGEPYRAAKIFELQSILYKTDYFSRVVVRGKPSAAKENAIPIEIELVAPEHRNKYSIGVGYATDTGIRGKVDWKNRLYNDRGHTISGGVQIAELENILSLNYEIPRKNPRYQKLVHSVAYQDKTWDDTTTQLLTGAVYQEYSGPRFKFSTGLEIRDEVYDVGETSGESTLLLPSVNAGFVVADDILYTKNGLQASVGVLGALEGAVSDASFLQATINGKAIISPLEKLRVIGRGSLGGTLVDSIDSIPPSVRFYTGGDSTIRGYSYKSIGTEDSSGAVIGGRYLVVGSIEAERAFKEFWSLAAFWDAGTATDDLTLDFYQGAGVGLRFRLPFGQIKFDVASAISEEGSPVRVHITVGSDL